ncbi:glutamate--cysteine ligase [Gryllotalpicola protaetiae]|uniref:Putative glutamate--cysteine ligase 2 n=1 Tax=Gryllotalpicola protaetiae TaxID=2419771 RepID=A0A387BRW0_9MICO|nr:glutamate--cysteine ligase [Gryllotalpicola protaetiae]AYG03799.1 glutamate--cysteine ligase [Gryllotalpicola protaetiae]
MEIPFAQSPRSSVGLEWELMLADQDSGELVPAAPGILQVLDGGEKITAELLTNTVEVTSDPRERVGDAIGDIRSRVELVRAEAERHGVALLSSGSHPFAKWQDQNITEKSRYRTLIDRAQWWGRNLMIWGIHMHVGVDDRRKVIPIVSELTKYLPHLQALSASSPFWAGDQTGYASNRALVFQQLPTAGLPWQLADWEGFEGYVDDLVRTGVLAEVTEVRWDVRPAPRWGTIEVRACDAASNLFEFAAIAAFAQCLVEWCSRRLDAGEEFAQLQPWFHRENKWRAARYGMDVELIVDRDGRELHVRDHLAELLPALEPIADDLGCRAELAGIHTILDLGAGYQRQLQVAQRRDGDLTAVVKHLIAEFDAERPLPVR